MADWYKCHVCLCRLCTGYKCPSWRGVYDKCYDNGCIGYKWVKYECDYFENKLITKRYRLIKKRSMVLMVEPIRKLRDNLTDILNCIDEQKNITAYENGVDIEKLLASDIKYWSDITVKNNCLCSSCGVKKATNKIVTKTNKKIYLCFGCTEKALRNR